MDDSLDFAAIRGKQAGAAYFVIMAPLKVVPLLFKFDDDEVPATVRAQRILNKARVPQIARYITDNEREYILSSLCASVDGEMAFEPAAEVGSLRNVGRLKISLSATILINDGQHRRAAIEEAIRQRQALGEETISVVLFADRGLKRSQQMFADLNIHAVKPTKSLKLLYNHRDELAALSRKVVAEIPLFRDFTDFEHTSLSNRSSKLFTFSSLHQAIGELIGKPSRGRIEETDQAKAVAFWTEAIAHMADWRRVAARQATTSELRRDYIHAHGIAAQAIGIAGAQLMAQRPEDWSTSVCGLASIDWSRANYRLWEGRATLNGRINKTRTGVQLVANVITRAFGLELSVESGALEEHLAAVALLREAS